MTNTTTKKIITGVMGIDGEVRRFELRREYDDSLSLYLGPNGDLVDTIGSWEDYFREGYPLLFYESLEHYRQGLDKSVQEALWQDDPPEPKRWKLSALITRPFAWTISGEGWTEDLVAVFNKVADGDIIVTNAGNHEFSLWLWKRLGLKVKKPKVVFDKETRG